MTVAQQQRLEQEELQKAIVLEVMKGYCEQNGLSYEKLKKQRFYWIHGEAFFAVPSNVVPDGLRNDLETMPKPTLVVKLADGELQIKQTEHTKKYLS